MPDQGLDWRIREGGGQLVVELDGVHDSATAPDLAAQFGVLQVNGHQRVVLDLTRVKRVDSAGVAVRIVQLISVSPPRRVHRSHNPANPKGRLSSR